MKEGKLKDYCQVIAGQSPNGSAYNESGEGMEFHQGKKAFGEYVIQSSNVWTTEITKIAEKGDILMSVRAPVGPTNMTDRKICIGRGLAAIRCSNKVLPHFVLYALKNIESRIVGNDGAVFNSINKKMIEDLPLPQCTIAEQERIVERLDAAFAQIDELKSNAERQLAEARALFQSTLTQAMQPKSGWHEKTLKEIVDANCPISYGIVQQGEHVSDGIPVVRPIDLNQKYVERKGLKCTDESISNRYKRTILQGNEILLSVRGTTGVLSLASPELKGCNVNRGIVPLFFKDFILRDFVYYYMESPQMQRIFAEKTTGSTLKQINIKDLRFIGVIYPPLSEQQAIVEHLDALSNNVRELEEICRKTAAECDVLKQALLRQIFE